MLHNLTGKVCLRFSTQKLVLVTEIIFKFYNFFEVKLVHTNYAEDLANDYFRDQFTENLIFSVLDLLSFL